MQLHRGVSYEKSNSIPETSTTEISGVYRGVPWRKQPQNQRIVPRASVQLKYRVQSIFTLFVRRLTVS